MYNNKKFKALSNSDNGEVDSNLIFHYKQDQDIITCEYTGENIVIGHLIGIVNRDGKIDMRYHQVNKAGQLMTGQCISTPEYLPNGKIRLHEDWQWTSGDLSKGKSILEEL